MKYKKYNSVLRPVLVGLLASAMLLGLWVANSAHDAEDLHTLGGNGVNHVRAKASHKGSTHSIPRKANAPKSAPLPVTKVVPLAKGSLLERMDKIRKTQELQAEMARRQRDLEESAATNRGGQAQLGGDGGELTSSEAVESLANRGTQNKPKSSVVLARAAAQAKARPKKALVLSNRWSLGQDDAADDAQGELDWEALRVAEEAKQSAREAWVSGDGSTPAPTAGAARAGNSAIPPAAATDPQARAAEEQQAAVGSSQSYYKRHRSKTQMKLEALCTQSGIGCEDLERKRKSEVWLLADDTVNDTDTDTEMEMDSEDPDTPKRLVKPKIVPTTAPKKPEVDTQHLNEAELQFMNNLVDMTINEKKFTEQEKMGVLLEEELVEENCALNKHGHTKCHKKKQAHISDQPSAGPTEMLDWT